MEIYFKKCWRQEINDTSLKMSFNIDDIIHIKAMFMWLQILQIFYVHYILKKRPARRGFRQILWLTSLMKQSGYFF